MEALCVDKIANGAKRITLCLCSAGGDVTAGIGLFNFLRMLPNSIEINTHCFGVCGSITVTILLAGSKRSADVISQFNTHAAKYVEGPRGGQISETTSLIIKPFKTILNWSDERIDQFFDESDKFFTPDEAKSLGIITEVKQFSFDDAAEVVNVAIPD